MSLVFLIYLVTDARKKHTIRPNIDDIKGFLKYLSKQFIKKRNMLHDQFMRIITEICMILRVNGLNMNLLWWNFDEKLWKAEFRKNALSNLLSICFFKGRSVNQHEGRWQSDMMSGFFFHFANLYSASERKLTSTLLQELLDSSVEQINSNLCLVHTFNFERRWFFVHYFYFFYQFFSNWFLIFRSCVGISYSIWWWPSHLVIFASRFLSIPNIQAFCSFMYWHIKESLEEVLNIQQTTQ